MTAIQRLEMYRDMHTANLPIHELTNPKQAKCDREVIKGATEAIALLETTN